MRSHTGPWTAVLGQSTCQWQAPRVLQVLDDAIFVDLLMLQMVMQR